MVAEHGHKCPLCFEFVRLKDLKSIKIVQPHQFKQGERITLELMRRAKDCVVPVSKNRYLQHGGQHIRGGDPDEQFGRIVITEDLRPIFQAEAQELQTATNEAASSQDPAHPFYLMALNALYERESEWVKDNAAIIAKADAKRGEEAKLSAVPVLTDLKSSSDKTNAITDIEDAWSDAEEENPIPATANAATPSVGTTSAATTTTTTTTTATASVNQEAPQQQKQQANSKLDGKAELTNSDKGKLPPQQDGTWFFYQSIDGQPIFLHPSNMKYLLYEYQTYENLPEKIQARIIHMDEEQKVDEITRKKYKFLSFLPITTPFQFCELDMKRLLSPHTLHHFNAEIRSKYRQYYRSQQQQQQKAQPGVSTSHDADHTNHSDNTSSSQSTGTNSNAVVETPPPSTPPSAAPTASTAPLAIPTPGREPSPAISPASSPSPTPSPAAAGPSFLKAVMEPKKKTPEQVFGVVKSVKKGKQLVLLSNSTQRKL